MLSGEALTAWIIRIEYIKLATKKVKDLIYIYIYIYIYIIVKKLFHERAPKRDEVLQLCQTVHLHKKGDRNDVINYRGVCLLAMGSRILAKFLSKKLRNSAECLGLLDDNQSGFRTGRSTADATQILVRITEDTKTQMI